MKKDVIPAILGGALGTAFRIAFDVVLSLMFFSLSWVSIMSINAAGSFLLAFLVGGLWTRPSTPHWVKVFLGPGLLGAFTTFSGVMLQGMLLGNMWITASFLALSIGTSMFAALLGFWAGSPFARTSRRKGVKR